MVIELCLFDLDDTLLRTTDLEPFRGQANVGRRPVEVVYPAKLATAFGDPNSRAIYLPAHHAALRAAHRRMKWGVFTRSPRLYANLLLGKAYPGLRWDAVVAYEDVRNTKPHGDGVWKAMEQVGIKHIDRVAIVGDDKVDVQTAYQAGCWAILDQSSWERRWAPPRYWATERVPDAIIRSPDELSDVLANIERYLPGLEFLNANPRADNPNALRIDALNHFFPFPDTGRVPIACMGRLFGEYQTLRPRRQWHALTDQILAHKDARRFPDAWIHAIRTYLARVGGNCVVTVIPFKPGRTPRMEALLEQVRKSDLAHPVRAGFHIEFAPGLLAFDDGAVSSHGQHLTREQRFANVGANLRVAQADVARRRRIVVIDDVTTTGASLLWAHRYLMQAGAQAVSCLSLTKTVGIG